MKGVSIAPVLLAVLVTIPGCVTSPNESTSRSGMTPSHPKGCVTPSPIEREGYLLEGHCPESEPLEVGQRQSVIVGAVHKSPCWSPPDFAGSFWRTHTYLQPDAMSALHGGVKGTMVLLEEDEAVIQAPAVETRERIGEPFERVPAEGRFVLWFHRIEGAIRRVGCA